MTKKELRERAAEIRKTYPNYKMQGLATQLVAHGVEGDDYAYIMAGGEQVGAKPYPVAQSWLDGAMDRMEERLPAEKAQEVRRAGACCLGGVRDKLAKEIRANNSTVDARFAALARTRQIIGGKAWRQNDDFFVSYWYDKPVGGYTCACLHHVPKDKPMNRLWCVCCAQHIRHHFQTALGVEADCTCLSSALSSCGEETCLFQLNIVQVLPDKA